MKFNIFYILLLVSSFVSAQQDHHYTQFMYNKLAINPGYAGARGVPSLSGIYRNQWLGFEGAPVSQLVSFNSPIITKKVGLGVTLSHRTIGLSRDLIAQMAYSYDISAKEGNLLRIGIHGVARNISIDLTKVLPVTGPINAFSIDPSLAYRNVNTMTYNIGAGIYGSFQDVFYIGLSMPGIMPNTYGINTIPGATTAKEVQHIYGMLDAALRLNDQMVLMPSLLTKYVKNAPFDADLNLSLGINERITTGLSYRLGGDGLGESVDVMMMLNLSQQLGVGLSYDFALSKIKSQTKGSVELSAFYDLKKRETRNTKLNLSNPRFFF